MEETLFSSNIKRPLADRLRPTKLGDVVGQDHIVGKDAPLGRMLESGNITSFILWGPPGCGKTTLARLIANQVNAQFMELSAVSSGIKDIKETVAKANEALRYGQKTILFIDEIHRYSKTQQDVLLPYLEDGTLYLIGSTTENPSFQIAPALISRVQIIRLNAIDDESMAKIINKGFKYLEEHYQPIEYDKEVTKFIINNARGDARTALNMVENSYFASNFANNMRQLTVEILESITQKRNTRYSRQEHYDFASAFQKSLRGSDPDAAIYYLAKMIEAGEDPRFIARRLIVCSAEDVGNADPQALNIALNAHKAVEILGLPEGRIPLAQAVIYVAKAPKSNQACMAIDKALADIHSGLDFPPPMHLRDAHYKDAKKYGFGEGYIYTHDNPDSEQQFMPDELKDRKYLE